jgi:hypothetical protein
MGVVLLTIYSYGGVPCHTLSVWSVHGMEWKAETERRVAEYVSRNAVLEEELKSFKAYMQVCAGLSLSLSLTLSLSLCVCVCRSLSLSLSLSHANSLILLLPPLIQTDDHFEVQEADCEVEEKVLMPEFAAALVSPGTDKANHTTLADNR